MARRNIAKEIEAGLRGIVADLDGTGPKLKTRVVAVPDVRQIREGLGLSQSQFSTRFGLSARTVQDWEQKRRAPDQIAAVLLKVIEAKPAVVQKVMAGERSGGFTTALRKHQMGRKAKRPIAKAARQRA